MANYYQEKFENDAGREVIVCWRQDKHIHNTAIIPLIEKWLEDEQGGQWKVRGNSYHPRSSCGENALFYDGKS